MTNHMLVVADLERENALLPTIVEAVSTGPKADRSPPRWPIGSGIHGRQQESSRVFKLTFPA